MSQKIPEGYKISPVGIIPDHWDVKQLGNLCSNFKSGYSITSENITKKGAYSVYGGNGLRGYTEKYTHTGDYFLIGRQGALCGNIERIAGRNYVSEHAIAVQTNEENSLSFLSYKLEFLELNRLSESSAQPGLSVEKLVKLKISVPPLEEQEVIANMLRTIDESILCHGQLIAQKELRKKWLMQQLLTGKKRLKGFNRDWKEYHLGDLFAERNETGHSGLLLLSVGSSGVYPQSESTKADTSNEDKSKYKRVQPGDVAYNTMRMWQGRSALSDLEGIVSPAYTVVKSKPGTNAAYFSYLFKTEVLIHRFFRNSQGLVEDTLNCKFRDFAIIKVIVPPFGEQIAIAEVLKKADSEIRLLRLKVDKLKEQKKGMMQVLLTGKKRLKPQAV